MNKDRATAPELEDPIMTNQEIYDAQKRIKKDTERMLRHYEAMKLED